MGAVNLQRVFVLLPAEIESTAKRRAAFVQSLLKGESCAQATARKHGLTEQLADRSQSDRRRDVRQGDQYHAAEIDPPPQR